METSSRYRHVALVVASLAASAAYLVWRIGWTLGGAWWLAVPLVAAEAVLIIRFALWCTTVTPSPRDVATVHPAHEEPPLDRVEVLVPAVDVSHDDLSRTLLVLSPDNDSRVHVRVLSDANDPALAAEAERAGAGFEVIPAAVATGDSVRARAALIDAARRTVGTPVFAWVDAGDVPVPGFFDLLGAFDDSSVAVVQSAADMMNPTTLRRVVPRGDETALENCVQGPSLDRDGVGPWEGSGSLVRTDALERIGGLPLDRGTATHRAAARFTRSGDAVRFSTPALLRSLAPQQLDEYLDSAAGRARGDWQILWSNDTPLRPAPPGRGRGRRSAAQVHDSTAPLDAVARLTVVAVLLGVLLSGSSPVDVPLAAVGLAFVGQLALRSWATRRLAASTMQIGDTTRQGLRLAEARLRALAPRASAPLRGGRLRLLTAAVLAVDLALVARGLTFVAPDMLPRFSDADRLIVMAAAVWTLVPMVDVLGVLVGRGQRRSRHRVETELVAEMDGRACRLVDLTPAGVGALVNAPVPDEIDLSLSIPRLHGAPTEVNLRATVRHRGPANDSSLTRIGAVFTDVDARTRDALVEYCALTADLRDAAGSDVPGQRPDALDTAGSPGARTVVGAFSVACLVLASTVAMAGPAAASAKGERSAAVPNGSISGTVVDSSGAPLDMGCVNASDGMRWWWANTNADGSYSLEGLPVGTYRVTADGCGNPAYVPTYHPSTYWQSEAVEVAVTEGSGAAADVMVLDGAQLSGATYDQAGDPIAGICASAVRPDGDSWQWIGGTTEDGRFAGTVPSDTELLVNLADCKRPPRVSSTWLPGGDMETATVYQLPVGGTLDTGPIVLEAGALLTGTVSDESGEPLEGICASAHVVSDGWWNHVEGTQTGSDGSWSFMIDPGTYSLWFSECRDDRSMVGQWYPDAPVWQEDPPTVDVVAGTNASFDTVLSAGGRAAGLVTDTAGSPATGVCVSLLDAGGLVTNDWRSSSWSQVDLDGSWDSGPVPAGDYLVNYRNCDDDGPWLEEIRSDFLVESSSDLGLIEPISIEAGSDTTGLVDDLDRGVRLSGIVTDAASGEAVDDVCIGGPSGLREYSQGGGAWSAHVPAGTYEIVATDCRPGRGLTQTTLSFEATEAGGDQLVELAMAPGAPGNISGSALNGSGTPLAPVCAVAYVPDEVVGMAMADEAGRFIIEGLGAGTYHLGVFGCDEDPTVPMVDPDTGVNYGPVWFPGVPIDFVDDGPPSTDGATPLTVGAGGDVAAEFCFGACEGPPPSTTPPNDTPPSSTEPMPPPDPRGFTGPPTIPSPPATPGPPRIAGSVEVAPVPPRPAQLDTWTAGAEGAGPSTTPPAPSTSTVTDRAEVDAAGQDPVATAPPMGDPVAGPDTTDEVAFDLVPQSDSGGAGGSAWDLAAGSALLVTTIVALLLARRRRLRT